MGYGQALFLYIAGIKILDALVVIASCHLCWVFRFEFALFPITRGIPEFHLYSGTALPLALVFSGVFHAVGAYRKDRIHFGFRCLKKVVQGALLGTLVFVSFCYFQGAIIYSRLYLVIFFFVVLALLLVSRAFLHLAWVKLRSEVIKKIRVLLVGQGDLLNMYFQKICEKNPYPVEWVGRIGASASTMPSGLPYLGEESSLKMIIHSKSIDLVIISYPTEDRSHTSRVLEELSNELVGIRVIPDFGRYSTFTYSADHEYGIPLLLFNQTPISFSDRFIKRCVDVTGSILLMVLFLPLTLIITFVIKLTSQGPILFRQERVGADGSKFTLYKFRSMKVDAERDTGAVWARERDDRTTWIGKWIRKFSLDEIPQFYNVLKGDMSLVGPRPERPVFVAQFRENVPKYMLRHRMKSGITGWAQVNGWRGNTSIEERIRHDLFYIGHWSHFLDLKILCLTLFRGFINKHAY